MGNGALYMEDEDCIYWNRKGGGGNKGCSHPDSKQMGCWLRNYCYLTKQCKLFEKDD